MTQETILLVEDTYGVGFHRTIIEKLRENNQLSQTKIRVERLPAKKCNPAIIRKILAKTIDKKKTRIIIVIDTENRDPKTAIEKDIKQHLENHFKNKTKPRNLEIHITTIHPYHEAWLCIGLGANKQKCRKNPIQQIETLLNTKYEKHMLATQAKHIDINKLKEEKDFKQYLKLLKA